MNKALLFCLCVLISVFYRGCASNIISTKLIESNILLTYEFKSGTGPGNCVGVNHVVFTISFNSGY